MYVTWYFLLLNALLGASLMACSYTRQLPMVKVARNWKFMTRRKAFAKLGFARELESARGADLAVLLRKSGYQVRAPERESPPPCRARLLSSCGPYTPHRRLHSPRPVDRFFH